MVPVENVRVEFTGDGGSRTLVGMIKTAIDARSRSIEVGDTHQAWPTKKNTM